MPLSVDDFAAFHAAVHRGFQPFPWQTRLLRSVVQERRWPAVLDLPTGSGKTSCIDIALFALALDASDPKERWCPRRIALVVDRRIVVDQAAARGRVLLDALCNPSAPQVVRDVAACLRSLGSDGTEPLAICTLRGGIPKDDGWARTPDQPLVIASTVDQVGSRLLLQGYGVTPSMRPVHAGLLANDTLLLLDEVHLSTAFADTLAQLSVLRERHAGALGVPSRFAHVFLSATPHLPQQPAFGLIADDRKPDSALASRLEVSKPSRIREVAGRAELEDACAVEAQALAKRHDVTAVVVNRVKSASRIARLLSAAVRDDLDVVLLTGRMRPLDRDDVLATVRDRVTTGRDRHAASRKLVLVATQCIEAGADFDLDALVTESASLDALRQRFGRVDRLGSYRRAEGAIVHDKSAKSDPVYGDAIAGTVSWLKTQLHPPGKTVDFGISAMDARRDEMPETLFTRKSSAPVLLPAYLDLWMQTSPPPAAVPDVALWLHGPDTGPADVQFVWRADLSEDDLAAAAPGGEASTVSRLTSIVGAIPPSSLEAMSIPIGAARQWLAGLDAGDMPDVEGAEVPLEAADGGVAFRWRGDTSDLASAGTISPGDTLVVPATRGGIRNGCFDGSSHAPVVDLAERAALVGRGQPLLRLHDVVLAQLGLSGLPDDPREAREALSGLDEDPQRPSWRTHLLRELARGSRSFVVDAEEPWAVLLGRRVRPAELRRVLWADDTLEEASASTTDGDDSWTGARTPVTLDVHSRDVERLAREFAERLGFPASLVSDLALAGWLHDVGKADRRFQLLLRAGGEIDYFKDETPWAKSTLPPGSIAERIRARQRSGYPTGARHEVASVAMLHGQRERMGALAHDLELVLFLVGSHHGFCRPFAPAVADPSLAFVTLTTHGDDSFGTLDLDAPSNHGLYRLDSPLADRFWGLVERYGWHELCWLEAVLRLADHRASERGAWGGA